MHTLPASATTIQLIGRVLEDGKTVRYESTAYYNVNSLLCGNADYSFEFRIIDWHFYVSGGGVDQAAGQFFTLKRIGFNVTGRGSSQDHVAVGDNAGSYRFTSNFHKNANIKIYFDLLFNNDDYILNDTDITIPPSSLLRMTSSNCYMVPAMNSKFSSYNQSAYLLKSNLSLRLESSNSVKVNPDIKTCAIDGATDQTVQLDTVFKHELDRNTTVQAGNFAIRLNCSQATATHSYIVYSDGNNNANTSNLLTLDSRSTAKGVGIQVVDETTGAAIKFAPIPTAQFIKVSQVTSFSAVNSANRYITRNYTVNYVKNGTVTAGDLSAKMVYTLLYR
ncbi:fimbrial protein [Psittacicella hinzii]|uniref:fimbrial protein n=1 Tax=Psittacicella hinzii TaxID=2028575 RepID=UPI001CA658BF|nr:fimbrial protein [Psittacicella hinzii]